MNYILSFIFGIVQGVTEFFPVSSSGHLILLHDFFNFNLSDNTAFDVALHLGTFLALLIYFWKDLVCLIKSFFNFKSREPQDLQNRHLIKLILIGIVPAGIVGYFFESLIEFYLRSSWVVVVMLVLVGVVFILVEKFKKSQQNLAQMSFKQALVVGLAQILAFVPGTSRSGITISAGMASGLSREASARFSFFMAIPLIFGASLAKALDLIKINMTTSELLMFAIGLGSSLLVGYFAIKYLLKIVSKYRLNAFAYYRFGLAILVAIYLLIQ